MQVPLNLHPTLGPSFSPELRNYCTWKSFGIRLRFAVAICRSIRDAWASIPRQTVRMVFEPVLRGGFHTRPDVNCKTFISGLKQGRRPIVDTRANEAIPGWGTGGLISHLYLQIIHGETVDLCSWCPALCFYSTWSLALHGDGLISPQPQGHGMLQNEMLPLFNWAQKDLCPGSQSWKAMALSSL